MTTGRDPLERLKALNPILAGQLDDAVLSPMALTLFREIVASDPSERVLPFRLPTPPRRRRMTRLGLAVGAVTFSAGAAGYALIGIHPSKAQTAACFAAADLSADSAVVGAGPAGAVASCSALWAEGIFGPMAEPDLRACRLVSGVTGVFPEAPGADVCLQLGLVSMSPADSGGPESDRFVAFRSAVVDRFLGQACVAPEPAAAIVREELDRAGLGGWAVVTADGEAGGGYSAERPCTILTFRPDQRTVALVSTAPPPSG